MTDYICFRDENYYKRCVFVPEEKVSASKVDGFVNCGSYIPKEGNIQYWGKGSNINNITYEQYLILEDAGCIFLPATGYFSTTFNSWRDGEDEGHYVSCTHYSGSIGYHTRLLESPSQISPSTKSSAADYYPVRLVKAI